MGQEPNATAWCSSLLYSTMVLTCASACFQINGGNENRSGVPKSAHLLGSKVFQCFSRAKRTSYHAGCSYTPAATRKADSMPLRGPNYGLPNSQSAARGFRRHGTTCTVAIACACHDVEGTKQLRCSITMPPCLHETDSTPATSNINCLAQEGRQLKRSKSSKPWTVLR